MIHTDHPGFPSFFLIIPYFIMFKLGHVPPIYFNVSSDYMWLHIRGVGEWTNRLYNYFEREQDKLHSVEEQLAGNRQLVINGTPEPQGIKRLQT